jgi:hypothetical protein
MRVREYARERKSFQTRNSLMPPSPKDTLVRHVIPQQLDLYLCMNKHKLLGEALEEGRRVPGSRPGFG